MMACSDPGITASPINSYMKGFFATYAFAGTNVPLVTNIFLVMGHGHCDYSKAMNHS